MLLGVIADDFTGASDIANTLTKGIPGQGGPRTTQFLGVPKQPALPGRCRCHFAQEPIRCGTRGHHTIPRSPVLAAGAGMPAIRIKPVGR